MEREEKIATKVYGFIKSNLLNGVVIITALAYVFYNMISIKQTGLSIYEVLAQAGMGIVIAFVIKQALGESGFNKGYRSTIWANSLDKYSRACNLANPYIEKIDLFYDDQEKEKKLKYRTNNLMAVRLRYDDFFDEDGNYTNPEIRKAKRNQLSYGDSYTEIFYLTRKQRKVLKKCIEVKIYNLNLFSEYSNELENTTHREKTDKDQRNMMWAKNSFTAVITAIFGAYFLPMWNGWDWADFIISTVQVCVWVGCGIVQLYTNYNYVVIEKTSKLTKKIELIVKFVRKCENGQYGCKENEEVENNGKEQKEVNSSVASIPTNEFSNSNSIHTS